MNWDNIPKELKVLLQWVCWGVDPNNPKMPHNPNNMTPAKASDPTTWGSFELAVQRIREGVALGVGFEFHNNGIIGIDLDHCRNKETGEVTAWAQEIVDNFDSFTEISMSGTGLHIFIKGNKPGQQCKTTLNKDTKEAIEIYDNGRYFAMTGNVYHNAPIAERQANLDALYNKLFAVEEIVSAPVETSQTWDYLHIGLQHDAKLSNLWNGQRNSTDESANDLALMNKLAYWCNKDRQAMITAFLSSPFAEQKDEAHKKKLQREDYLPRTADTAIASCRSTAAEDNERYNKTQSLRQSENPKESNKLDKPNGGLNVISAQDLLNANLPPIQYLIEDILPMGTSILAGAPKAGKGWFVLLMSLRIAAGEPFLRWETNQAGVLYLSFEDSPQRLQGRMNKLLDGTPAPPWFFLTTTVVNLDDGLLDHINDFIKVHPEIKLVIIDTLQKVRGQQVRGEQWYSQDYRELGAIKEEMDRKGVSVLFVHHLTKTKDKDDPFNEIAGTTAISGAMDTMMVLKKPSRKAKRATLHVTGRDVEDDEINIVMNEDNCQWEFLGDAEAVAREDALADYQVSKLPKTIKALLDETPDKRWAGNAKSLLQAGERLFKTPLAPSAQGLSKSLAAQKDLLLEVDGIVYEITSNGNAGNTHRFRYDVLPDYTDVWASVNKVSDNDTEI